MGDATRITAVRHGETAWNVAGRIQGQLDVPLNDTGRLQAQQLASALAKAAGGTPGLATSGASSTSAIAAIYASDLWRAYDTALTVSQATGVALVGDEGLRERGFGQFQGKTFTEIEAQWPDEAKQWRLRTPEWTPPDGESLVQVRDRVVRAMANLAQRHLGQHIVLVTHGGVLDAWYRTATGQALDAPRTWTLDNAAINRLLWTPDSLTLVGWADQQHLQTTARDEIHN